MSLERKIQKITVPTIEIDEMKMGNTDDPKNELYSRDSRPHQSGSLFPLVQINKYSFSENEISYFKLDLTDYIPRVTVVVAQGDGRFLSKSYPKDGDPLSVFIRSRVKEFNPIRCDFEITSISSAPSTDSTGNTVIYNIEASLRIPRLHAEFCKAYKNMNSYDALLELATDMKLGFASNELVTDDKMTWLCPFDSYKKFMMDITKASYKDDDSFFETWIDHFYIMNFVNVNNQFGEEFDVENAFETLNASNDYNEGQTVEVENTKLLLSNHKNLRGSGNWIAGYTLLNNCGQVVQSNGYRRYVQFYDMNIDGEPNTKYQSYFIEPLSTAGVDDKILMRGRVKEPEIYKEQNKNKFMGIQISNPTGQVHANYMHAIVNNFQNTQEIDKMILHVSLTKANFNLYRGQRIPLLILNEPGTQRAVMTQDPEAPENPKLVQDKFLSGYYYIKGMNISWSESDANFYQDLYLARREWPIPHQASENTSQG